MKALYIFSIVFLASCGSTTKITSSKGFEHIAGRKIYFQLVTAAGAQSIYGGGVLGSTSIVGGSAMDGEAQSVMAAKNLLFELRSLGLDFTQNQNEAEVIANFSIGTVQYDPIAGWIADQAFLEFLETNGDHILSVKAKTQFVTPTTENMVKSIVKELENALNNAYASKFG